MCFLPRWGMSTCSAVTEGSWRHWAPLGEMPGVHPFLTEQLNVFGGFTAALGKEERERPALVYSVELLGKVEERYGI